MVGQNPSPPPALAGDYNGNGSVGSEDYTLWQDQRGDFVTPFSGTDGNGNGIVDAADYQVWKNNFGATPGTTSVLGQTSLGTISPRTVVQAATNVAIAAPASQPLAATELRLLPETTNLALESDSHGSPFDRQGLKSENLLQSVRTGRASSITDPLLVRTGQITSDRSTARDAGSTDAFFRTVGTSSKTLPAIKGLDELDLVLRDLVVLALFDGP
jgi:hypothetical protein